MLRRPILVVCALVVGLALAACCRDLSLSLGRVRDFLSGVLEISLTAEGSLFVSSSFSGDFRGFANIPLFDEGGIAADLSGATWQAAVLEFDVDLDGFAEETRLLLPQGVQASGSRLIFVAWRGDSYTVDKGVCYLGWPESGRVKLAASRCGKSSGVMYCSMPANDETLARCEFCPATGACGACDMTGDFDDCLPAEKISGSLDIDIDIDADIDFDLDHDRDSEAERHAGEP